MVIQGIKKKRSYCGVTSLILFSLFILFSCSKQPFEDTSSFFELSINADNIKVKTEINGNTLKWDNRDNIGIFINGVQNNINLTYDGDGSFSGIMNSKGVDPSERDVYAYYPYSTSYCDSSAIVIGKLQPYQDAPFDGKNDYMVADISSILYNEGNMPSHSIHFGHHLFSLLKITFTNSDAQYESQSIYNVRIQSKTKNLCGSFSFDVSKGIDSEASFITQYNDTLKYIDIHFPSIKELGTGVLHSFYAIIPSGQYESGDLSITVYSDEYQSTVTTQKSINLEKGTIYQLETIDFSKNITASVDKKTVICFGDSITTSEMTGQLQFLLGIDWKVYIAGVPGERMLQIMARQGTAPIYLAGGFSIPSSKNETVDVGSCFYTTFNTDGSISLKPYNSIIINLGYYNGNYSPCPLTNPFKIHGVECEITSNNNRLLLRRLSDGEIVDCSSEEYVLAVPCAAWKHSTSTVTTLYMGANGVFSSYDVLASEYLRVMQDVNPNGFIGVGFHHTSWNSSYKEVMYKSLGENYLDLRTEGCLKAEQIMYELGLQLSDKDYINLSHGVWPVSWDRDGTHPSETGAKAYAYLIYYKMKELGYVE